MAFGPRLEVEVPDKDGGDPLTVRLAPLSKEVVPEFVKNGGMQSFKVTRFLGDRGTTAPVIEDEYDWFENVRQNPDSVAWGVYLCRDGDEQLVGNTALSRFERTALGIQAVSGVLLFDPEVWGKGIAKHIHKARTWYAFTQLGITRITSAVVHGNGASLAALKQCGYTHVYVERNTVFIDGEWCHQDNLECLNPLDSFWQRWWGSDTPSNASLEARAKTIEVLDWAKQSVRIL